MLTSAPTRVAARTFELDLRHLPHSHRHSVVFARLDELGSEDRMIVVCESEPTACIRRSTRGGPGNSTGRAGPARRRLRACRSLAGNEGCPSRRPTACSPPSAEQRRSARLWLRPFEGILPFLPGEYVLLEPCDRLRVPPRSYSIANAPRADGVISLLVTRVPGGRTSTWIHDQLRPGDEVSIDGPYGSFVDDPACTGPVSVPGGRIGSGADAGTHRGSARGRHASRSDADLLRTDRADVIDGERFLGLQQRHAQFRFIRTLTRASGPPPTGRIPALLPGLGRELGGHDVFIAGAPGFVSACAAATEALGVAAERVHTEPFFVEPQRSSGAE